MMDAVRFAVGTEDVVEGWLVPFGTKDTYGTTFTRQTDFCLDWFTQRPWLYHHGLDGEVRTDPIGVISALEVRDAGLWMQAQLTAHNEYVDAVRELVKKGALGLSSGAMAHLVEVDEASGEVQRWPLVEGSATPTPSNLNATIDLHTFKSHVRAAGIDLPPDALQRLGDEDDPAMRAVWSTAYQNDLPDSAFLIVESGGTKDEEGKTTPRSLRHFPVKDASGSLDDAHVRNALARIPQSNLSAALKSKALARARRYAKQLGIDVSQESGRSALRQVDDGADEDDPAGYDGSYEDLISDLRDLLNPSTPFSQAGYSAIIATYPDHVLCCRWDGYADGDSNDDEQTYWRVDYAVGADGEPILGAATQVEQTYVPVASSRSALGPLTLDAHHLTLHAGALAQRTQDLSDRRIREGRVLSAHNRQLLADAHGRMGEAHAALGDLLAATDRQGEEAARATQWGDPAYRRQQFALLDLFASTVD